MVALVEAMVMRLVLYSGVGTGVGVSFAGEIRKRIRTESGVMVCDRDRCGGDRD